MNFQDMIIRLNTFWAAQGCVIWQPHNVQVGAGTSNPATVLRVLGPEPWNVAYPEPSARPADGRYGENPNRWYEYFQYQVILKPDPGNHIDLYLESLDALGITRKYHDIRFVEDNWQSPSLGAWGLGWEVWLDGLEITQYTYFQQACGVELNPVSVEITYGLERIAMFTQGVSSIAEIQWMGDISYGDLHLPDEIDYCKFNFDYADIARLKQLYSIFEDEAKSAITHGLVLPAHDHLLKCSHVFNVMDARGAVGVSQRANYFSRMREISRQIADIYLKQRESLGFPFVNREAIRIKPISHIRRHNTATKVDMPTDFLFEIGTEELPARDLSLALEQFKELLPKYFRDARLNYCQLHVAGTPRRLILFVEKLKPYQSGDVHLIKGPPMQIAFDLQGNPTQIAKGFARKVNLPLDNLQKREFKGKQYLTAVVTDQGRPTLEILAQVMPQILAEIKFPLSMRWNDTQVTFSRPIRWLVALYGEELVNVTYASVPTDRISYGPRRLGSPELVIANTGEYFSLLKTNGIVVDVSERRSRIHEQLNLMATEVGGQIFEDPDLLDEVTNLVECPVAIMGSFDASFLHLPHEVLITVMKKHQRYFPVVKNDQLLPYFIVVTNGGEQEEIIQTGNEAVLSARFTDAKFFYESDIRQPLSSFVSKLDSLAFQEQLGSYLDKITRLRELVLALSNRLNISNEDKDLSYRTAELAKADLASAMVIEFTILQGIMGRYYAERSGEDSRVATGIFEHYLPRFSGDQLPTALPGMVVGLADRLDSLVGLFAVGLAPSGTTDPYSLRRVALGLVQILIEKNLPLSLQDIVSVAAALLPVPVSEETLSEVNDFIHRRLQALLLDKGFRYDLVDAILAEQGDNPASAFKAVATLSIWVQKPEFVELHRAFSRMAHLVREYDDNFPLSPEHLQEPATQRLYQMYLSIQHQIKKGRQLEELITNVLPMVGHINRFFDEVLVLHEDTHLRHARLGLLQHIAGLLKGVVDLSKVSEF